MLATGRTAPAKARKGRTATVRPLTKMLINGAETNSTTAARLQRLTALCGVVGPRAELIASLIWPEAHND